MLLQRTYQNQSLVTATFLSLFAIALSSCSSTGDSTTESTTVGDTAGETTGDAPNLSIDLSRFVADALISSDVVDCELSDGTATQCYELVTAGIAKPNDMIGPFCPGSTSSTDEEGGVWLDGTTLYQVDGSFILNLPNIYSDQYPPAENWILYDENGLVRITDTLESCQAAARPDVDPEYQSHCVECALEDLEIDLSLTFTIPVVPQVAETLGNLTPSAGISLNGFQIASQAPVEAILSNYTIAAFDDCGGHVNPNDGYHYHSATAHEGCNSAGADEDGHPKLIGYAMDGYGIYGPLSADDEELSLLDECNGSEDSIRGYHYHASSAESNEHIGCFRGKTVAVANERPPRPQ